MATRKAKRKNKPKGKKPAKGLPGLNRLVKQALSDDDFVRQLEKNPSAALKQHGYPYDAALVKEIKKINFKVFREAFPSRFKNYWC